MGKRFWLTGCPLDEMSLFGHGGPTMKKLTRRLFIKGGLLFAGVVIPGLGLVTCTKKSEPHYTGPAGPGGGGGDPQRKSGDPGYGYGYGDSYGYGYGSAHSCACTCQTASSNPTAYGCGQYGQPNYGYGYCICSGYGTVYGWGCWC